MSNKSDHQIKNPQLLVTQPLIREYIQKMRAYFSDLSKYSTLELGHLCRGISFCTPLSKKSAACEPSHVLTPSINFMLLLKGCDPNHFFG
jgi:hypothetical protein